MKLKEIDKSTLKPGDVVGIAYSVKIGWRYFRYQKIIPKKIKRITPARTKFITEDGCEYGKCDWFYEVNAESERQTKVALCAESIYKALSDIEDIEREGNLFSKSDDVLVALSGILNTAMEKLQEDKKK